MNSEKLNHTLDRLESHIKDYTIINTRVSQGSIAWHIDHSLKVINNVCNASIESDPSTYLNNFTFLGKLFFTLGFFPRGKAKAPKHVKPPKVITEESLVLQIEDARSNINKINTLDKNAYFNHPLFGHVNTTRVNRFLILHTNHHLKIINDILKQQKTLSK
ncbi:DUF1569 domain-containing protein [Olleya marilimosa]|uniref:DUF1569 domain-containing protein n=1 Tax=Olleya marilimosa TaxID=272164 RepID=UPI0030EC3A1D|tara:strand:- start:14797 stop:15279 length:483 start_codon:yes stop_codon:yes gene_type:complete